MIHTLKFWTSMLKSDYFTELNGFISETKPALKQQYAKRLAEDLSRQQWQDCFQRNVLLVLEEFYADALCHIQSIPFNANQQQIHNGMSDLTLQVTAAFQGFIDEFLLFVVDKHRTSCALSNFPDEHKPDKDYVNAVKRDIAKLWQQFALNVNNHFLDNL
jgi:monoamine oxidase